MSGGQQKGGQQTRKQPTGIYKKYSGYIKQIYIKNHPLYIGSNEQDPKFILKGKENKIINNKEKIKELKATNLFELLQVSLNQLIEDYNQEISSYLVGNPPKIELHATTSQKSFDSIAVWTLIDLPDLTKEEKHKYVQRLIEPLAGELDIRYGLTPDEKIMLIIPDVQGLTQKTIKSAIENFRKWRYFYMSWNDKVCCLSLNIENSSGFDIQTTVRNFLEKSKETNEKRNQEYKEFKETVDARPLGSQFTFHASPPRPGKI